MKQLIPVITFIILATSSLYAVEGMYPMSEIHRLDLQNQGFEISPEAIYNPDGISLIDGICKVGGCTGSFVSPDGLILTNHHCAFRAIQTASTAEHDYLKNGFASKQRSDEIPAPAYTVRITESYRDVSDEVLSVVTDDMDPAARTRAIEKRSKELVTQFEADHPGKRADISEMFIGKTYVLFVYIYLKDIRLVYAPPRSIGEFGGETDNWMWPRHTCDFSFMRAYVAPDGSPAEYATENVPYHPKTHLQVQPKGVDEGDFAFIFGYPGRTYRHRTSHFLAYEQDVRMPWVADWYQWQIEVMEKIGEQDRDIALKHASKIKGLSNTMKNYRGKLLGMKRLHLVDKKREEEARLQQFIESDPQRAARYGSLLEDFDALYREMRTQADYNYTLYYLGRSVTMLSVAKTIYEAAVERQKPEVERKKAYMERNFDQTKKRLKLTLKNYYAPTDQQVFRELINKAQQLPSEQRIAAIDALLEEQELDDFFKEAYATTILTNAETVLHLLDETPDGLQHVSDPFLELITTLYPLYEAYDEASKARKGAFDKLYARFIEVKAAWQKQQFIPDANGTLRLTFGRIRSYSPADGVRMQPITTVMGVMEKHTGHSPFNVPEKLQTLIRTRSFGQFAHPKLGAVPACILYDMDTTGGNSGSPVLNARGQLIGLNFDRVFEATINDFAWSQDYSRSIGVDIRYILWIVQQFGDGDALLQEMGIN